MEEDENENEDQNEEQKKKEPPTPVTKKIFLNDMNSWFSSFVIENLRTDSKPDALIKYEFMGTTQKTKKTLPRLFTPQEIKIDYNLNYKNPVFSNDVFVYKLDKANFNEAEYIIKGLKALKYDTEKILVIISSIMTWARTPPKYKKEGEEQQEEENPEEEGEKKNEGEEEKEPESEEEEYVPEEEPEEEKEEEKQEEKEEGEENKEEPKKILYFKEKDYIKRIPSEKFYSYKMIETLALSNTNPKLKTYIVCPGMIYGCGEEILYDYFLRAWLEQPPKLPIIGKGKNTIPTIHIIDLVSLIKRVIEEKPKSQYIFAFDHTKNRTLKNIITSISKGVGTGLVENVEEKDYNTVPHYEYLSIDIKGKSTKVFLDEKKDDEEDEAFEKRQFKWHCEFGISENIEKLRKEFNSYRGLKNVKIMITGPPGSGKSSLADKLSKYYNIPHFKIADIVAWGKTLTDELGEEIKAKMEEIENAVKEAEENYIKRPNKKITDKPLDVSQISKLPDEIIIKLLRRKLASNICMNRGYVLDGYPRGYKNAFNLYNEDTDESKSPDDPEKYKLLVDIMPNSVILIDKCDDKLLKARHKKLKDIKNDPTIIERRLNRRLKAYKELNESPKGESSLIDYYSENKIDINKIDGKKKIDEILDQCQTFIERNGKIKNFQTFQSVIEKGEKEKLKEVIVKKGVKHDKELRENEFYDNEKDKVKKSFNEEKIEEKEKQEKILFEKRSEVVGRYLQENVIPVLSKGILHVCQTLPDDPVDALALFLFEHADQAKFPPNKYKDQ